MAIARRLNSGECGAGYAESVMVLCAAISALAAELWPGRRKDKARFVEVLIQYSPKSLDVSRLSLPLLVGGLAEAQFNNEAAVLENKFLRFDRSQVLTGADADHFEGEVLSLCPTLTTEFLRRFSYASLIYEEVRSAYAHQYSTGERADSWPTTLRKGVSVSYANWLNDPHRHIHFHFEWVARVAIEVAKSIDLASPSFPCIGTNVWWVNGTAP
ncbi:MULTISPECIES: hypothetical protein [Metallibacterium]|uniref:hypothetical protein n=1 Tax=Metallibacterium TaxID=1218803 RepID=UPI0026350082|nr:MULTISPECIES: hypothetical protein [Metallibacterium]MBW8074833.1 hypothetical protein [Metallibacterium scheffleri]